MIGFFFCRIIAYVAVSPAAFIEHHNLSSKAFALLFAVGIFGLMVTNQINARLVTRIGSDRLLVAGAVGAAIFGFAVTAAAFTEMGGFWYPAIATWLFAAINSLTWANAISALGSAIQSLGGVLGAGLVGFLADGSPRPMGAVMGISA